MNKCIDFERWDPPLVEEKKLVTEVGRRKKNRILLVLSGVLMLHFGIGLAAVLWLSQMDADLALLCFCSFGGVIWLFSAVMVLIGIKRRDYFYD